MKEHVHTLICVCCNAELQQSSSDDEEWVLTQAIDYTSYRNLKANEMDMRMWRAEITGLSYIFSYNKIKTKTTYTQSSL